MTNVCVWVRVAAEREPSPSEAAVDSQSVEIATMISEEVGYDAGKQVHGRKVCRGEVPHGELYVNDI